MPDRLDLEFVLVPDGEFIIGSSRSADRRAGADEMPQHRLRVTDFHIMRFPVTNAQYRLYLAATGQRPPLYWPEGQELVAKAGHPVVGVSLQDALAFSCWAAEMTGLPLRLPAEPEWEKAARGSDGRLYPWGNAWDPARCNNRETPNPAARQSLQMARNLLRAHPEVVGTMPAGCCSPQGDSPYGVADMAGNVQTWCLSYFGSYPYDPGDGREALLADPTQAGLFPGSHETGAISNAERPEASAGKLVVRGGSWHGSRDQARCAYRSWAPPMHRGDDTGIRLCYE